MTAPTDKTPDAARVREIVAQARSWADRIFSGEEKPPISFDLANACNILSETSEALLAERDAQAAKNAKLEHELGEIGALKERAEKAERALYWPMERIEDARFERRLATAYANNGPEEWARELSGRLRQMNLRSAAANKRADEAEQKLNASEARATAAEDHLRALLREAGQYVDDARDDEDFEASNNAYALLEAIKVALTTPNLAPDGASSPASGDGRGAWQPIRSAPKYEQILLYVDYTQGDHALEDADHAITIGSWLDDQGWNFAGWSWQSDLYVAGEGTPTHWMPLPASPMFAAPPAPASQGRADAGEAHYSRDYVSASLASMIVEWVEGAGEIGTDWKPGLATVIDARLRRLVPALASASPVPPTSANRVAPELRSAAVAGEASAEIKRLVSYAEHKSSCSAKRALPFELRGGLVKCSCGLDEARAALASASAATARATCTRVIEDGMPS